MAKPKRVLVAPLNWGLGHATRCIPLIEELLAQGAVVLLASDGTALRLLQKEFPQLPAFELPAYNIHYQSANMVWNMAWQWPKILMAIRKEHQCIQQLVQQENIDIIIADNRYGCHHPNTKNIFLTHQLNLKIPTLLLRSMVNGFNRFSLRSFDHIWIPDLAGSPNLSGELSHPTNLTHVQYLGLLSRMKYFEQPKKYDLAVILSGPEPQRTYLEKKIKDQLVQLTELRVILVQGLTQTEYREVIGTLEIVSYLTSRELNEVMLSADLIICRSGYSSLMDLAKLRRKALLIPTPGQTEQEYLAAHLQSQGFFLSTNQENLNLKESLPSTKKYLGFPEDYFSNGNFQQILSDLLSS